MPIALSILLFSFADPASAALEPLRPYVGHCWSAELAGNAIDRHCFRPVFGGKHIRDEHVVTKDGVTVYSGETIYSVEADRIVFTYWNSLGGVGRGTARAAGADLYFSLTMRATPDAAPLSIETVWRKGNDRFDVTTGKDVRHFRLDD